MKKTIILTLLALSLVACDEKDLDDPRIKDALNQKEVAENIEEPEEENQAVESEDQNEEDQEINRTYPDDDVKKDVISVESSNEKEASKEEKSDEKQAKKEKKSKKKDKKSSNKDKKALTEDDYFFSYYSLVSVRDGEVINVLEDLKDYGKNYFMDYVPFSNNIFVVGSAMDQKFSIKKINGQDLTLMYDFDKGQTFYPLAMIDDKIYGRYQYYY